MNFESAKILLLQDPRKFWTLVGSEITDAIAREVCAALDGQMEGSGLEDNPAMFAQEF